MTMDPRNLCAYLVKIGWLNQEQARHSLREYQFSGNSIAFQNLLHQLRYISQPQLHQLQNWINTQGGLSSPGTIPSPFETSEENSIPLIGGSFKKYKIEAKLEEGGKNEEGRSQKRILASKTRVGAIIGTPGYMPPEQALGEDEQISHLSDIFSLGIILYELLALKRAFPGNDSLQVLFSITKGHLIPPREAAPEKDIPRALEAIVLKAMAHKPEDRYQSVEKMHRDIQNFLNNDSISVYHPPFTERMTQFLRKHVAALMVMASIFLLIAIFSYFLAMENQKKMEQQKKAKENALLATKNANRATREERKRREMADRRILASAPYTLAKTFLSQEPTFDNLKKIVVPNFKKAISICPEYWEARVDLLKTYILLIQWDKVPGELFGFIEALPEGQYGPFKKSIAFMLTNTTFSQRGVGGLGKEEMEKLKTFKLPMAPKSYNLAIKKEIGLRILKEHLKKYPEALDRIRLEEVLKKFQ